MPRRTKNAPLSLKTPPGVGISDLFGQAYQRDHSWYMSSHGGSASRYHFLAADKCASRCGRAKMLLTDSAHDADTVPTVLRCCARGCREHWPNEKLTDRSAERQ